MADKLEENMRHAHAAISEALTFTPQGSDNKDSTPVKKRHGLGPRPDRYFTSVQEARDYQVQLRNERRQLLGKRRQLLGERGDTDSRSFLNEIMLSSQAARTIGHGNCGELASIAFASLYQRGIKPLDYMAFDAPDYDHCWVVIGRAEGTADRLDTWGPNAVWCDPWGAPGGLCFPVERLLRRRGIRKNEFHHAILSVKRRRFVLTAAVIQRGLPTVMYRSS